MIITIARQCGCSGDKIGQALAEKYKIPFFDKEGIKKIAKEKDCWKNIHIFMEKCHLIH